MATSSLDAAQLLPLGPELQVNTSATDEAYYPDVDADDAGRFVIVWEEYGGDGSRLGVAARRFDETGAAQGAQFTVNTYTIDDQRDPSVATTPSGGFVVVWTGYYQPGGAADDIVGRVFDPAGTALASEFLVNTYTSHEQRNGAVDVAADGSFVVAWDSYNQGHGSDVADIYAQRFDASGGPVGAELNVVLDEYYNQDEPGIGVRGSGDFVVAWTQDFAADAVSARSFDASATPQGPAFGIGGDDALQAARVAVAPDGSMFIAFQNECCANGDVVGRLLDPTGVPVGSEFVVNSYTTGYQGFPDVGVDAAGTFLVVWQSFVSGHRGVYGRLFDASGAAQGSEFVVVDDGASGSNHYPTVDGGGTGRFVVAYQNDAGVAARLFKTAGACGTTPLTGCKQPTLEFKGRLGLKDKTPDKGDSLVWKWVKGEATSSGDIGDPLATDSYRFCLYDGGAVLIGAGEVDPGGTCGTKPCWKGLGSPVGAKGFKYVNKDANADGIQRVILKVGDEGQATTIVKGKGANLAMPAIPLALPVTAQLVSSTGACWSAEFRADGVLKNEPGVFAGKAGTGSPSGAFLD